MVYFQSLIPKSGANLLRESSLWEIDPFFLHHPSKHVPLKTVIPLLSNWFPNSIQIKLISQRLSSTTRLNWRRQAHKHEFNGKIKSKPLKKLGTVHVVYVYLSNTPILILLSSKQKMPQCLVESLNSFNWCMESICNRSLLLRHFSFERQMARKVSSKFKWAGILWIISQFSSWNWQCNGLSAVKTTARQHSNCARNRVQFKKDILTLYTLISLCIFSTLFSIHFLRCWPGEFV